MPLQFRVEIHHPGCPVLGVTFRSDGQLLAFKVQVAPPDLQSLRAPCPGIGHEPDVVDKLLGVLCDRFGFVALLASAESGRAKFLQVGTGEKCALLLCYFQGSHVLRGKRLNPPVFNRPLQNVAEHDDIKIHRPRVAASLKAFCDERVDVELLDLVQPGLAQMSFPVGQPVRFLLNCAWFFGALAAADEAQVGLHVVAELGRPVQGGEVVVRPFGFEPIKFRLGLGRGGNGVPIFVNQRHPSDLLLPGGGIFKR